MLNYKSRAKHLFISLAILLFVYILFAPNSYKSVDEHDYYANSVNIVNNDLRMECDQVNDPSQFKVGDYCIYKYNIGTSILLIPSAILGLNYAFYITLGFFILAIVIFYKLLMRYDLSGKYIYLFAFFPPVVFYSRTIYSEIFSLTFFLLGFFLLTSKNNGWQKILSGLVFGAAVLIRYTNIFPILIFLIVYLVKKKPKVLIKDLLKISLGAIVPALSFFLINDYLYGNIFRSGYYYSGEEALIVFEELIKFFPIYIALLLLMYPGMLVGAILSKVDFRKPLLISVLFLAVFYGSFPGGNTVFEGRLLDLILGMRYFLVLTPLLILSYVKFLDRFQDKKYFKLIYTLTIIILVGNFMLMSYLHQQFLLGG